MKSATKMMRIERKSYGCLTTAFTNLRRGYRGWMMIEQVKPWKIIFKGTIAEGPSCPYCGKRGYGNEDRCDYCGKKVKPLRNMSTLNKTGGT